MAATFGTITTDTGVRHWVATMPAAGAVAYAVVVAPYSCCWKAAGHRSLFERPNLFNEVMTTTVLPQT